MDMGLKDAVALVTGGGQGVGRAICKELAAEGAVVFVNDLFPERAGSVADEIVKAGGKAYPAAADITDMAQVERMIAEAKAKAGQVTVLVNNAGIVPERREKGGRTPLFLDMP